MDEPEKTSVHGSGEGSPSPFPGAQSPTTPYPVEPFETEHWTGEKLAELEVAGGVEGLIGLLTDPGSTVATVHWGRNYLYRVSLPPRGSDTTFSRDLVVKQFRNVGWRKTLDRRLRGSKATRSWRMARAFEAAGIPTARPVMLIESKKPDGPSFFVTEHLADRVEARYVFRAVNEGQLEEQFPGLDYEHFLSVLGQALRRMHGAGFFHRDLSIGNVLLPEGATRPAVDELAIIDLNRGRVRSEVGFRERQRDLCRLTLHRRRDQLLFLEGYWGRPPSVLERLAYGAYHYGFRLKIDGKKTIRAPFRGLAEWLKPRRAHVHIPEAPSGAGARDKIVWDALSDQPHQHAGKLEKLKVRLADAPSHLHHAAIVAAALPRLALRYRRLKRELYSTSAPWPGAGICVRPYPEAPGELLRAIDDLGLRQVLLRLHPWQEEHGPEEELAEELHRRGYDLAYSLPQNRDLVRDPGLWERRIRDLADRFLPYGKVFQVGQAINRSKWGIWRYDEYLDLARRAATILRDDPEVRLIGPAVIDFELYSTLAVVNRRACPRFDALASLLYVDRRGAPENRQIGFDTLDKSLLCRAIADTSRAISGSSWSGGRSWITEVNWPLWEGPHSPAGKSVSVSETAQADYLARYYLQALATGAAERVYWWQMIARGYGLVAPQDPQGDAFGLRRRPAFFALKTLERQLSGRRFVGRLASSPGTWLMDFEGLVVGWSESGPRQIEWPGNRPTAMVEQDGESRDVSASNLVELTDSIRYFRI